MDPHGVWSGLAGGVVAVESSKEAAEADRVQLVADGEDGDDLEVIPLCPDHQEEPRDGCEECEAEDE